MWEVLEGETWTQLHFSGPGRIYRETDRETDANKSRQRPGNRHADTRETQPRLHRANRAGFGRGEGRGEGLNCRCPWGLCGSGLEGAGLHRCSSGPDKDMLPTRVPLSTAPKTTPGHSILGRGSVLTQW